MTTVLIVDDSRVSRMMISTIIKDAKPSWNILEAGDSDAALNIIKNESPEVMIVDYNMPGMDGITLCSKLKEQFPQSKITLLTANIQDSIQHKVAELGVNFVGKPITEKKIRAILDMAGK